MEHLRINKLGTLPTCAQDIPSLLDQNGIQWNSIAENNWAESFPYQPSVCFRIAHTGQQILLHYKVEETCIRAIAEQDNDNVYEDSCCEFFFQQKEGPSYYNLECNCAGTLLLGFRENPQSKEHATPEMLQLIDRWSSLGREKRLLQEGDFHWQLALLVPVAVFFQSNINSLDGIHARCNFYKCGDHLSRPHFLSWQPIKTDKPNFHVPQFFGECLFEDHCL